MIYIVSAPYLQCFQYFAVTAPVGARAAILTGEPGGGGDFNRFSSVGAWPVAEIEAAAPGLPVVLRVHGDETIRSGGCEQVLRWAQRELMSRGGGKVEAASPLPPGAPSGGFIGYLSYESGARFERMPVRRWDAPMPEIWFGFYACVYVADHERREGWLVRRELAGPEADRHAREAEARLREWIERAAAVDAGAVQVEPRSAGDAAGGEWREGWEASLGAEEYRERIERIRRHLRAGDIYQANLTVRYRRAYEGDSRRLFAALLEHNPAPFCAYLEPPGGTILSTSPELFLDLKGDRRIETRPIKGTAARSASGGTDPGFEALAASEKDRAEHVMIVDLERNDLGRVCAPGSIHVDPLMRVESFRGLHHLVSAVKGRLAERRDVADALAALFPGGSITGAPKIRAMEILHELEPVARGVYTGAIGWISPEGEARLNIAIRTLALHEGRLDLHVGGGIVIASDPEQEFEECRIKGAAMARAVEAAISAKTARNTAPGTLFQNSQI